MLKVMTWFWQQTPNRAGYTPDTVNRWIEMVRTHLTIPHQIAVVTNLPEGIDPSVELIPLPDAFLNVRIPEWSEKSGLPQCYRRLTLFAPDAAEIFGADELVSMDLDVLILRSMNHLFPPGVDFQMFGGTSSVRPYNGSMVRIRAGARAQVFAQFAADPIAVAKRARSMFIGSDQAVISMILGKGERTWRDQEGVYHYSPRFARTHGRLFRHAPPPNLSMLFFPGNVKPWSPSAHAEFPWIGQSYRKEPIPMGQYGNPAKVRLRAYRDPKGWGTAFVHAANKRKHFCSVFSQTRAVHNGVAFVRLDQQAEQREISIGIVRELNLRGIPTLPTLTEANWYDDKGAQLPVLQPWMPKTWHIGNLDEAVALADKLAYPIISKGIDGASSKTVRIIRSKEEAIVEARQAFSGHGIPSAYKRVQRGYVYWQKIVEHNPCDYRVCVIGGFAYGLVRNNKKGTIFASGSGDNYPITMKDDRERAAMKRGVEIADAIMTDWMCFDFVFDGDTPLVLEMSSAWTMKAYDNCTMYDRKTLEPTDRKATESFLVAVDVCADIWKRTIQPC